MAVGVGIRTGCRYLRRLFARDGLVRNVRRRFCGVLRVEAGRHDELGDWKGLWNAHIPVDDIPRGSTWNGGGGIIGRIVGRSRCGTRDVRRLTPSRPSSSPSVAALVFVSAVIANYAESILGATVQTKSEESTGIVALLTNDVVNVLQTSLASLIAVLVCGNFV